MSVDRDLYSRQIYAVGADAQKKYSEANVLIVGCSGLGVEVAKNLILTGVKSVAVFDSELVSYYDLSTNFYASEQDIGCSRTDSVISRLSELNPYVKVYSISGDLSPNIIRDFQCVILCDVGFSTSRALSLSRTTRDMGIKFISCETNGLVANIFTDFGNDFWISDINGVEYPLCLVTSISTDGLVICHDDKPHQLQNGDVVVFSQLPGSCGLYNDKEYVVKNVHTPYNFSIQLSDNAGLSGTAYLNGYVTGKKQPSLVHFKSLEESMKNPEFTISDFGKMSNTKELHAFYQAVHSFKTTHNRLPLAGNVNEANDVIEIMQSYLEPGQNFDRPLFTEFAKMSIGSYVGLTAFIGGLASHETLKALSGKYTPIMQWYYFDARECISIGSIDDSHRQPLNSRYDGQIAIFGTEFLSKFHSQRFFIVGAGALGCELMKNFACAGLCSGSEGSVTITDMDLIEKSNLSRQFLFRSHDIGCLKSQCAARAAKAMNPKMNVIVMNDKVSEETTHIFDDDFWDNLTGVCTALDNVAARLFVDSQCVKYRRPMVDSGTLGSKANAQVVIPHLTESYASSRDPPEKSVPVCTLKNFPTAIEHTIQWARDTFEGLFNSQIHDVLEYFRNDSFITSMKHSEPAQLPFTINNIVGTLRTRPNNFDDCIKYARLRFEELFKNTILQLLHNFPLDAVTASGTPFWTGPKKPPQPIEYDACNELHLHFVSTCAFLRAANFSIQVSCVEKTEEYIANISRSVLVPQFEPRKVKISVEENNKEDEQDASNILFTINDLPEREPNKTLINGLKVTSFEKDDDDNHHIAFITACSNLRATNYKIPLADFDQTKQIAGRIIPAMVTTTALITGLVMIEVAKLSCLPKDKWTLETFRNSFVSLEIALTAFSDPVAPPLNCYGPPSNPKMVSWTLWDTLEVDLGRDVTLQELIDHVMNVYKLEISMMSCGQGLIYSFFGNASKSRLSMPVSKAVESVTKKILHINQKYLTFDAVCSMEDVDVDTPSIRYRFRF